MSLMCKFSVSWVKIIEIKKNNKTFTAQTRKIAVAKVQSACGSSQVAILTQIRLKLTQLSC